VRKAAPVRTQARPIAVVRHRDPATLAPLPMLF
jgi:hypothetical protein